MKTKSAYISPIKTALSFSGGFGELRKNHFHTGLDFRTAGQTGLPVYAVNDGSVSRLAVSPSGYGHALYLLHPDGHTTVYGHLSHFDSKLENYVEEQQYRLKQFAVDLAVPAGLFSFKKGEIIARSGNTGSSGGPHLHFEVRETVSEKPLNPLFYLPAILDKSAPRINALYIYSRSVNSQNIVVAKKQRFETISTKGKTGLKSQQPLEVFGDLGIGIQTDDDFNGSGMKCGIYSAVLYCDQHPAFSFKMDHLDFEQGRYINSHIDYEELIKNRRWIHKLYLQPGNKLDIYQTNSDKGILPMSDGKSHDIKIVVADAYGNTNTLSFKVLSKEKTVVESRPAFTKLFNWDRPNEFENNEVKVNLPEGSLYDQLLFVYHQGIRKGPFVSAIHQIHNSFVPVHKAYLLSIKTNSIAPKLQSKALIVNVDQTGKFSSVGGEYLNGWITARPRVFGQFAVALDTIPPKIQSISIKDNKTLIDKQKIVFKITDNLSGIGSYSGEIDGNWVLFEYDAKSATVAFTLDKKRIEAGKAHSLNLTVEDERKNLALYKAKFYW